MANGFKINVALNFQIEKSTAETCLKLAEIYANSTKNKIVAKINTDGTEIYEFKNFKIANTKTTKKQEVK